MAKTSMLSRCSARLLVAVGILLCGTRVGHAVEGELRCFIPGPVSLQDFAYDPDDDVFWISNFLSGTIHRYAGDLSGEEQVLPAPFPLGGFPTGLAYNSHDRTLFVVEVLSSEIIEMDKTGAATGRTIRPDFSGIVTDTLPTIRGIAFDPGGDGGRGSIYGVETAGTLIFEVSLGGDLLRWFIHPDDRNGALGGQPAPASGLDLIFEDGALSGFYLIGGRDRVDRIRRLDREGRETGIEISLESAGGNVSSVLRRSFGCPGDGLEDTFLCAVESNARFAVLEGGEPDFRQIVEFTCERQGREVIMNWRDTQPYDRIEITRGCETIAVLPGDAQEWRQSLDVDGIYEFVLRAYSGPEFSEPPACAVVVGAGTVKHASAASGSIPIDLTTDGRGTLFVTDGRSAEVVLYDAFLRETDIVPVGSFTLHEALLGEGEFVSGIAYARRPPERLYVFNTTTARLGIHDEVGALIEIVDVDLPNLEDDPEAEMPDFGFVEAMTFDPRGDDAAGSLWLMETVEDRIYEIDLTGAVIRSFPHPYLAVDPPPPDAPFGISCGAIADAGGDGNELFLSGGTLRDTRDIHIFRMDKRTGRAIPGSVLPTADLRAGSLTLEYAEERDGPRLFVLEHLGGDSRLSEISLEPPVPGAPLFFEARQSGFAPEAALSWTPGDAYDAVEVFRDCELLSQLPGEATEFVDAEAAVGLHSYRVRGVRAGKVSDFAETEVRLGPGAVLARRLMWPARSPQQLTRDPVDGSYLATVNWPGDERKLYRYDRNLHFVGVRDSAVETPFQIATLAVRATPRGREIYSITWILPVPVDQVASQRFELVRERLDGSLLARTVIEPPRPTNGFITFPTGLAWESSSDTFYYLERNSRTVVQVNADGETVREFPHPSPPFQNFVFALGLSVAGERGTIFLTGAEDTDHDVSKAMEMTFGGELTGVEIPLGHIDAVLTGISIHGTDLVAVGTGRKFSEIFRIQALPEEAGEFVRGDINADRQMNLTDVLVLLNYLFLDGPAPRCEDAADTNDEGVLNLADALHLLNFLFDLGAAELPPPYPDTGIDPTTDGLVCPP